MSILTFPSGVRLPSAATLKLMSLTQAQLSPFDGSVQTLEMPGARWHATLSWQPMPPADWRPLQAFVNSLRGRAGRFYYNHPMAWRRATAAAGTPLVNGAGQTGVALITDGWTHGATVMLAGDFFWYVDASSRSRMHQVTADVVADGSGNATLAFTPPLRLSPADNATIAVTGVQATWMLSSDDAGEFGQAGANATRGSTSLDIIEALV